MSLHQTSSEPAGQPIYASAVSTRLHSHTLTWVGGMCIATIVAMLVIYFASIPPYFGSFKPCVQTPRA